MLEEKTILVAPLNWGLGHATRCIPIIQQLQHQNARVIIGSNGSALEILRQEFPSLPTVQLNDFQIHYSRYVPFLLKLASQIPHFLYHCREEQQRIRKIVQEYGVDGIISDHRYGVRHKDIPSVILSHQLHLSLPPSLQNFRSLIQSFHQRFLKPFDQIWVPDFPQSPLTGQLSQPRQQLPNTHFIGPLSRFERPPSSKRTQKYDILALLSGPEPQRTLLESKFIKQLKNTDYSTLLVRGTHQNLKVEVPPHVESVNLLHSRELQQTFPQARWIIGRAGYSSIMDFIKIGRTGALIPTRGQTEQEYLARHLQQQNLFYTVSQKEFDLDECIEALKSGKYAIPESFQQSSAQFLPLLTQLFDAPPVSSVQMGQASS